MTLQEALIEMAKGNKVTHKTFGSTEYLYVRGFQVLNEDNYLEDYDFSLNYIYLKDWLIYEN